MNRLKAEKIPLAVANVIFNIIAIVTYVFIVTQSVCDLLQVVFPLSYSRHCI